MNENKHSYEEVTIVVPLKPVQIYFPPESKKLAKVLDFLFNEEIFTISLNDETIEKLREITTVTEIKNE